MTDLLEKGYLFTVGLGEQRRSTKDNVIKIVNCDGYLQFKH